MIGGGVNPAREGMGRLDEVVGVHEQRHHRMWFWASAGVSWAS